MDIRCIGINHAVIRKDFSDMRLFRQVRIWGRHHRIELFGTVLGALLLILLINSISICVYASRKNDRLLSEHAVFADSFTTSLSGKNGKISQIYVNTERNKCVILFQFDDMNGMVTDAAKYQVFIKSFDVFKGEYASRRRTQLDVMGGFYVFGTTGYTALYLSAVNGFPGECYEIILRCNDVLQINADSSENENVARDASYAQFDQWRVIINPNGNTARECSFLDDFDITSLYQDAVIDENEGEIRENLYDDVKTMYSNWKKIDNYRNNLESLNVRVPSLPVYIAGDELAADENGIIRYNPGIYSEEGVDYDWYGKTLHDTSFLDMVKSADMTDVQFFNSLNNYQASDSSLTSDTWYMADGSVISFDESSLKLSNMQAVVENIRGYNQALKDYYNAKRLYHCTHLIDYLYLESNMKMAGKYFTSNYNEGVVTVW